MFRLAAKVEWRRRSGETSPTAQLTAFIQTLPGSELKSPSLSLPGVVSCDRAHFPHGMGLHCAGVFKKQADTGAKAQPEGEVF